MAKSKKQIPVVEHTNGDHQPESVQVVEEAPKPREFTPRDCTLCITSRPPRQQFSRVYAKKGKIRYCKCGFCGNTWAQEGD